MKLKYKELFYKHELACEAVMAFLIMIGVGYLFGLTKTKEYLLALLIFISLLTLVRVGIKSISKRRLKCALWFAIPFGLAFWFGHKVRNQSVEIGDFAVFDVIAIVAVIAVAVLMVVCALAFIDKHQFLPQKLNKGGNDKKWLVYAVIIFVCWLPLFLSFFPGIVSTDSAVQLRQAIGEGAWSNWHPVLHTAFVALPVTIGFNVFGDLTAGIALATLLQMVVLCLIFGYTASWVIRKTSKQWVGYLFVAFFGLCPVVACYAITMWKDVLFSAVFMLLVLKIYDLVTVWKREEKVTWKDLWKIFGLVLLVAFLRNGGILIILALGLALIVFYKRSRKVICVMTLTCLVITLIIQGPIYIALGITKSPFMESMSVPVQQIGYVAQADGLDEEEKGVLDKYADIEKLADNYSPMNADPAKNSFDYDVVEEDKIGFIKAWLMIMKGHFTDYIKAYVLQTYAYWYVEGDVWVLDFGHTHDEQWLKQEYRDVPLLGEPVRSLMERIEAGLLNTSWLGWIANVGVLCWGTVFIMMVFIYQKKYYVLVPLACVLIYVISLLVASPVSWIFRYVYSLLLIIPILVVASFIKQKEGEKK